MRNIFSIREERARSPISALYLFPHFPMAHTHRIHHQHHYRDYEDEQDFSSLVILFFALSVMFFVGLVMYAVALDSSVQMPSDGVNIQLQRTTEPGMLN